jgi:nucleoside-diphosphate-sugar epimerase
MKILVMGGTKFLGRAVVDHALQAGHRVALFNRGRTNPDLYPDVEHLVGDRDADLSALRGRTFDAVVDTSAYYPRQARSLVETLEERFEHYTFVSTVSVYADNSTAGADESANLATVEDATIESDDDYGGFKALCEQELDGLIPGRVHHVRAGLIFGPHDDTGRFSYWAQRIAAGGQVLAPEPQDQPLQFIDVRDLGAWIVRAAEHRIVGAINASGTPGSLTMGELLNTIQATTNSDADLVWVSENFLADNEVAPWHDLPLWIPPGLTPSHTGFMSRDTSRALRLGLTLRPLAETISGALNNVPEASSDQNLARSPAAAKEPRLSRERERDLLGLWSGLL